MKKAKINDQVRSNKGIIGIVKNVYDSSVTIKILKNPTGIDYENNVTVINHKNYEII
ncbi:DUF2187 family protein [Bacillus sp. BRMEA1]|uniref:DUF2187 family protein n=1 Tax=Neobacillus endophyticus TaxID=2738405 RepID=UPI0015669216|nr:DUF2187 family protein [Neobacillus endophyticus]NRD77027.1 DUF2187 family protein [Neobacillus endophyticus]